jgi:hypothetical protein
MVFLQPKNFVTTLALDAQLSRFLPSILFFTISHDELEVKASDEEEEEDGEEGGGGAKCKFIVTTPDLMDGIVTNRTQEQPHCQTLNLRVSV